MNQTRVFAQSELEAMQSKTYPRFFANSFGTLDHFRVDCRAEELARGLHLVILMKDTALEKDYPASSVPRVYYEPLTSSRSDVRLLSQRVMVGQQIFIH